MINAALFCELLRYFPHSVGGYKTFCKKNPAFHHCTSFQMWILNYSQESMSKYVLVNSICAMPLLI